MSKMKKLSSLLFVSMLALACLAGCGKTKEQPEVPEEDSSVYETEQEYSQAQTPEPTKEPETTVTRAESIAAELGKPAEEVTFFKKEFAYENDALYVNETDYWIPPRGYVRVEPADSNTVGFFTYGYGCYVNPANGWADGKDTVLAAFQAKDYQGVLFGLEKDAGAAEIKAYLDRTYGEPVATKEVEAKYSGTDTYYSYHVSEDVVLVLSANKDTVKSNTMLCLKEYLGFFLGEELAAELGCSYGFEASCRTEFGETLGKDGTLSLQLADRIFTFSGLDEAEVDDDWMASYYTDEEGMNHVYSIGLDQRSSRSEFPNFLLFGASGTLADYIHCFYDAGLEKETHWEVVEEGEGYKIYRDLLDLDSRWPYVVYLSDFDCNVNVVFSSLDKEEQSLAYAHEIIEYFRTSVTMEYAE